MNPLAEQLNQIILSENAHVFEMLSDMGKRFFFPSTGILSQSAEAKKLGDASLNATIGTAISHGKAMYLPSLMNQLPGISPDDALLYAPSTGLPKLRLLWQEKTFHDNPNLKGKPCSLPIVTEGLSHGLSLIADLIVNPGDLLILPDKNWGNYQLNFLERKEAVADYFPFFDQGKINVAGLRNCLKRAEKEGRTKCILLLNFPNNPTGYSPSEEEQNDIIDCIKESADRGMNLVVIADDAYYGLFFSREISPESIFSKLAGLHPRILAFKADAATKEVYVWGLRVGFVAYSVGGIAPGSPLLNALNEKMGGIIRSVVSSSPALSQHLVASALCSPTFYQERENNVAVIRERAQEVQRVLAAHPEYGEAWEVYPFNSGYFMCLKIRTVPATELRLELLRKYHAGAIAVNATDLRIAFSSLEREKIPELFSLIYQTWQEMRTREKLSCR